jgi:hypothetical protein
MPDQTNPVAPRYRPMVENAHEAPVVEEAKSATQEEMAQAEPAARWALEETERAYRAGGNEPGDTNPEARGMQAER